MKLNNILNLLLLLSFQFGWVGCDLNSSSTYSNDEALEIIDILANPEIIAPNEASTLKVFVNKSNEQLEYSWITNYGTISGTGAEVQYSFSAASCCMGTQRIDCSVTDNNGESATSTVYVVVAN
ncbi:MAG: hypothetical protein H8E72_06615 [Candidatus Marinimicrobia bacterium]|nr:hypothetical protein [Candidatus Neomarinimicrobiota bacterium]